VLAWTAAGAAVVAVINVVYLLLTSRTAVEKV
jgi:hypothetical protein